MLFWMDHDIIVSVEMRSESEANIAFFASNSLADTSRLGEADQVNHVLFARGCQVLRKAILHEFLFM